MTALLKPSLDLFPGTLSVGIPFEIGETLIEQHTLLGRDRKIFVREGVPERLDQLQAIAWAELQCRRQ